MIFYDFLRVKIYDHMKFAVFFKLTKFLNSTNFGMRKIATAIFIQFDEVTI